MPQGETLRDRIRAVNRAAAERVAALREERERNLREADAADAERRRSRGEK